MKRTNNSKHAIIIGAGIAGLAASIRLRCQGHRVSVYEANDYPGGKLTAFSEKGYRFDMGPSLFTMPQYVEELFEIAGKPIKDYFHYKQKQVVCNYFYEDGTRFSAVSDKEQFAFEAAKTFDVRQQDVSNYLLESKKKYDLTASLFLEQSLHQLSTYLSSDTIKAVIKIGGLGINNTLDTYNSTMFEDKRLVQFYNRFATYNGSSPYSTPAIMSMIPHLEQHYGTYFPKGGMHQISMSLYKLAKDIGVVFNFKTLVDKIETKGRKAVGVSIGSTKINADLVVANSDVVPTYRKLLRHHKAPERILKQPRSSSALIFYWGIKKRFPELDLHNIFFTEDYKTEFDYIFNHEDVYEDPTVYVNITSKDELLDAPNGCENWFTMINVPGNTGQNWDRIIDRSRGNIINKLSRILGTNLSDQIEFEAILDPRSIEARTQSFQGSLYGASSNNKFAAFLRHPNFTQRIANLYFCGGSVHPGGGIPLCLLSGKIVADLIEKRGVK